MDERHTNLKRYFGEQEYTLKNYILPFIQKHKKLGRNSKVLEVGCGYGGNLVPFLELGCHVTGIDILQGSIDFAKNKLAHFPSEKVTLIAADFRKVEGFDKKFDVIFMKDTIEHIPGHELLLEKLRSFLKDDGIIFQGFPPWRNPFGGHQQMCKSAFLSRLPWFHLMPRAAFKQILKSFNERPEKIEALLTDVYDTRISIQQFMHSVKKNKLKAEDRIFYFINPNYQIKFNLKPRKLLSIFNIPYLRDFYTTTAYYILSKGE